MQKKDGEILRVYTESGTAVVKKGDIVRKGQIVVKGEQGKEGTTHTVHATGVVIARTYAEETREVPLTKIKRIRTGRKIENCYVIILGKKIYLKNSINKFAKYDKIEKDEGFLKKDIYYEVKQQSVKYNFKTVANSTAESIYKNIQSNFDKSVKVVDKVLETSEGNNTCKVRVLVVCEENIATKDN